MIIYLLALSHFVNVLDLPPKTLPREKSSVPRIQVDVARKVQEDPLLKIRRQEEERKSMLREQMLIQQRLTSHNKKPANKPEEKSKKRKGRRSSSESSGDSDLDSKLALKLKQLKKPEKKESLDEKIAKKLHQLKKRRDSISSSTSSDAEKDKDQRKGKSHSSRRHERVGSKDSHTTGKFRTNDDYRQQGSSHDKNSFKDRRRRSRSRETDKNYRDSRPLPRPRVENNKMLNKRSSGMKLSEEELEKRRREMMQNAIVRDQERKIKVENYRKEVEEEAGQLNANRPKEAEFVK